MAVTNLTENQTYDHAKRIAQFSIAAIHAANDTLIDPENPDRGSVNIRIGFASGSVVADVVGSLSPRVCTEFHFLLAAGCQHGEAKIFTPA